ncbi:MAG: hypothetical protein GF364_02220, partial [Candidatus Lokiarchaeota archaeon]|nr:hypothetical protein [Candidatus Lokiarchaeota archaeon]
LILFWQSMHNGRIIKGGWSVCTIKYQISHDYGKTWDDWKFLRRMWFMVIRCRPLVTKDKKFILPIHREMGKYCSCFYIGNDPEFNQLPKIKSKIKARNTGLLEPCILESNGGELICLMRSSNVKRIHIARSNDNGLNWSAPKPIKLPNPNSQVDAITLNNGDILLAFNNQEQGRTNLSVALSNDNCESWQVIKTLFEDEKRTFHYPSLLQTEDDLIHLTYTDNRERIGYCKFNLDYLLS